MNKRTLDKKKTILGGRHPSTLRSMNNLALVLRYQGKYEEAEETHHHTDKHGLEGNQCWPKSI